MSNLIKEASHLALGDRIRARVAQGGIQAVVMAIDRSTPGDSEPVDLLG